MSLLRILGTWLRGLSTDPCCREPHILAHPDIPELVNLQEVKGEAKPYQIRQFLKLVERYNLKLEREE